MRGLRLLAFALLLGLAAPAAHAQFPGAIASLFNNVSSIGFGVGYGALSGAGGVDGDCGPAGVCTYQIEVFIDLPAPEGLTFELGLGTGVLRGFRMAEPSLDFRGSTRTLPSLGAYVTPDRFLGVDVVVPYAGVRTGFSHLWNARGYTPEGVPYAVSGEAFEYGVIGGLYLLRSPLRGVFLEASYHSRTFDGLAWSLPPGQPLPAGWPRSLDLSGWEVALGWQLRLPER